MYKTPFRTPICGALLLICLFLANTYWATAQTQPAKIRWFPVVKTAKDQHTLALLHADSRGFQLLRWQDRRSDPSGKVTPAQPLLTMLTPDGERVQDEPLPGFADGSQLFHFALPGDSVLLVAYEAPDAAGGQAFFMRRFNLIIRKWSAAPELVFSAPGSRAPAFAAAWFSRSADGLHWCLYTTQRSGDARQVSIAVLDQDFRLSWRRNFDIPGAADGVFLRQVFCTNGGAVLLHARVFSPGSTLKGRPFDEPPATYRPDGSPLFRTYEWAADVPAYSNALFLLQPGQTGTADFYPELKKKFTPSFEFSEGPDGQIYCAGLSADAHNDRVSGYFIYSIDPNTRQGTIWQNALLPASVRKLFLSEKAAAQKDPVEGLALRWLAWSDDTRPWLLLEHEDFSRNPGQVDVAAMIRLDSTYKITAARKIEKYQRLQSGDPQNFASLAACAAPKGAWWLLWNDGHWPDTKLMLTECRPAGTPVDHALDAASNSNVTFLPQTLLKRGARWYFVGESEYHERIRIGVLEGIF